MKIDKTRSENDEKTEGRKSMESDPIGSDELRNYANKKNIQSDRDLLKDFLLGKINIFASEKYQIYFVYKDLLPSKDVFCNVYVPWDRSSIDSDMELQFSIARQDVINWQEKEQRVRSFLSKYITN